MEGFCMSKIQNIFQENRDAFINGRILPQNKTKAIDSIESCRTHNLGSHKYDCPSCDYTKSLFNSCGNRHCPQCQNITKEQWVEARKSELINTHYFHAVFTLSDSLNPIIYANQKTCYDLMFNCIKETLTELAIDKKYLGAEIGVISVLHTWGQNLSFHPHIHCIIPGGGLSPSGIEFKQSRKKFFIPVKVLSKKFRLKFLHYLKILVAADSITIPTAINIDSLINELYANEWVVYCKPPFNSPMHVINYLSRYTHKIAISNSRIIKYEDNQVTFKWRDYKDNNKEKLMTLSATEFMRRFLLHVLPTRFVKIRYFGVLATRNRKTKLQKCQKLTGIDISSIKRKSRTEIITSIFGENIFNCPNCGCEFLNRHFLSPETLLE